MTLLIYSSDEWHSSDEFSDRNIKVQCLNKRVVKRIWRK
jgi:hypothetical protein